jgi:hypothetical protein
MGEGTKALGKITICMEEEFIFGRMEGNMKVDLQRISFFYR